MLHEELKKEGDADRIDTLECISGACETAVGILNDLLTVDNIDSGTLKLMKQEVSITQFLLHCADMFLPAAKDKRVELRTLLFQPDTPDSNWPIGAIPIGRADCVQVDLFKMHQVIRNIISNALKFTTAGGSITLKAFFIDNADSSIIKSSQRSKRKIGRGLSSIYKNNLNTKQVELIEYASAPEDFSQRGASLRIQIIDTGVGIDNESQKKMFNEIFQFNPEFLQGFMPSEFYCI